MNVLQLTITLLCLFVGLYSVAAKKKEKDLGRWGEWGKWSACSATCGSGFAEMTRSWIFGKDDPPHDETKEYTSSRIYSCVNEAVPHCPEDGTWSGWVSWTECSKPCNGGTKKRKRECMGVRYNGKPCEGKDKEDMACNKDPCPILPHNFDMSQCEATNMFTCKSKKMCIKKKEKCDKTVQCHDGSDEVGCPSRYRGRGSIRYDLSTDTATTISLARGFHWLIASLVLFSLVELLTHH